MWATEIGVRVLEGSERKLFANGLLSILDSSLWPDDPFEEPENYSIEVFGALTYGQKLSILREISGGLFDPNVPAVPLTANNEAAIAEVFQEINSRLEAEISDPQSGTFWRKLIFQACDETNLTEAVESEIDGSDLESFDEWEFVMDSLEERILWDYDFAMGENFQDLSPENLEIMQKKFTVSSDYFSHIPDDPPDFECQILWEQLRKHCLKYA